MACRAPGSPEQGHLQSLASARGRLNTVHPPNPPRAASTDCTQGPPPRRRRGRRLGICKPARVHSPANCSRHLLARSRASPAVVGLLPCGFSPPGDT
ncbi:unnamed protein product [Rangifer tarandus platyrhynchus]|uniref:Uncharacterized protein n=1 Tax=Rangifer tarandus platyrhynchus TaxID=3082113 RepID=A0ABN8YH60_RANTA|nr:unnamed protein product [Rangifer tarandus platyrhynchus]